MLYALSQYLEQIQFPGARMFAYVSFRSLASLILALLISSIAGKYFINYMKRNHHIESARDEQTDPYGVLKKGVPSMGGVIIVAAVVIPSLLLGRLDNIYTILLLVTILGSDCWALLMI